MKGYKAMKTNLVLPAGFLIALLAGVLVPYNANSRLATNVDPDISGEEIQALVVEDFEKGEIGENGWDLTSTPKPYVKEGEEEKNPVPLLEIKYIKAGPNDMAVEEWSLTDKGKEKEQCLGVRFQFRYSAPNSVHILVPPEVDWKEGTPVKRYNPRTRQDEQERGVQLPGRAQAISMWVHGRGKPYNMEVWVKDYLGATHILKMGSINFVGWRPMKVYIPSYVPQSTNTYPQTRISRITRFVLRADVNLNADDKNALTEETFVFFDQLKVLTDTYEVNFDGNNLHKLWDGGSGGNQNGGGAQ